MKTMARIVTVLLALGSAPVFAATQTYSVNLTDFAGLDSLRGQLVIDHPLRDGYYVSPADIVSVDLSATKGGRYTTVSTTEPLFEFMNSDVLYIYHNNTLEIDPQNPDSVLSILGAGTTGPYTGISVQYAIDPVLGIPLYMATAYFDDTTTSQAPIERSYVFATATNPISAVPEPSEWAMLLLGLAVLSLIAKRNKE